MSPTNNGSQRFDVAYPGVVLERLDRWADLAGQLDLKLAPADAIREMRSQLVHHPRSWGDPVRDLRGMDAVFYRHYGPILLVTYAVHNVRPAAFVQGVWLTPGSALDLADSDPPAASDRSDAR